MICIYYASGHDSLSEALCRPVTAFDATIERYRTLHHLSTRLRESHAQIMGALIVTQTAEELDGILTIKHLLANLPVLILIPDGKPETVSKGYALHPRYLGVMDECTPGEMVTLLVQLMEKRNCSGIQNSGARILNSGVRIQESGV